MTSGNRRPGKVAGRHEPLHGYHAVAVPAIRPLLSFDRDSPTSDSYQATDRSFRRGPTSHPPASFEQISSQSNGADGTTEIAKGGPTSKECIRGM